MRDDELMRQAIAGAIRDGLAQSRRDRFAAAALTGIFAGNFDGHLKTFADRAAIVADYLIASLDAPKEPGPDCVAVPREAVETAIRELYRVSPSRAAPMLRASLDAKATGGAS